MKRSLLAILLLVALTGCVPNQGYRTLLPPCAGQTACSVQVVQSTVGQQSDIPLAFIEFDDMGQAFNLGQIAAAEQTIQDSKKKHKQVVTLLFIHGWKNNASDDSNNVPAFRRFLQQFQPQLTELGPDIALVGVYFAWRGNVTNVPVAQDLTYWNRRDTATYIPGSNMSEALLRVARAAKGADYSDKSSKLIVVGHSFGGLVLERTVTQYLTRRVVETSGDFAPFADLLVFVNEAAAATEAIQFLTMLKQEVKHQEYPTIVSITSAGDLATGVVLPIGQGASLIKKSVRDYGPPYPADPFGITAQRTYYLRSAAHIPQLQSHVIGSGDDFKNAYNQTDNQGDRGYTCATISTPGSKDTNYYVVRISGAANTTPYWVMQMPVQIVPDHSDIFRLEFGYLLQAFVLRQAADEKPDANACYSHPSQLIEKQRPAIEKMKNTITVK